MGGLKGESGGSKSGGSMSGGESETFEQEIHSSGIKLESNRFACVDSHRLLSYLEFTV